MSDDCADTELIECDKCPEALNGKTFYIAKGAVNYRLCELCFQSSNVAAYKIYRAATTDGWILEHEAKKPRKLMASRT